MVGWLVLVLPLLLGRYYCAFESDGPTKLAEQPLGHHDDSEPLRFCCCCCLMNGDMNWTVLWTPSAIWECSTRRMGDDAR